MPMERRKLARKDSIATCCRNAIRREWTPPTGDMPRIEILMGRTSSPLGRRTMPSGRLPTRSWLGQNPSGSHVPQSDKADEASSRCNIQPSTLDFAHLRG